MADDPLIPGSMLAKNINNEQVTPESSCTGEVENIYAESVPTTTTDLTNEPSREHVEVPTAGGSAKQEVCSGICIGSTIKTRKHTPKAEAMICLDTFRLWGDHGGATLFGDPVCA